MSTRNPVFARMANPVVSDQELADMVNGTSAGLKLTIHDVIMKTTALFACVLVGAYAGWNVALTNPSILVISLVAALVLGLVNSFKRNVSPGLVIAYGLVEGLFIGSLSRFFESAYGPGLVRQAVLGTLIAFGSMLFAYQSGLIKVNGKFKKIFMVSMVSYLVIGVASLIASFAGVGDGWGFYGVGGLGIVLCLLGVALATFSLVMDFEFISEGIASGVPEREAWRMAFGLVVSLVWLYTELLRLLAIFSDD